MTKAPAVSRGFNLDALGGGAEELLAGYDQIQIRNGSQNVILQRTSEATPTRTVLNSNNQLAAVPAVGALPNALRNQQTANAKASGTGSTSQLIVFGGIGAVVLLGGILLLRRK